MARYRTAYNTLDRPVVVDDDGRVAAGGEWSPVLASHELVKAAVERGDLVFVDEPTGGAEGQAGEAFAATTALNDADTPEELATVAEDVGATPTPAAKRAAEKAAKAGEDK